MKVWSRHNIFRKENTCWDYFYGCIDLWMSTEWDDIDFTNIMKSHRWSNYVGEGRKRFIWLSLRFERTYQSKSNGFTMSYEMTRWWNIEMITRMNVSSMTSASLWMLISIHEYSKSIVKCLRGVMWMMNVIDTWWLCTNYENFDGLCLFLKVKFILEFLKMTRKVRVGLTRPT